MNQMEFDVLPVINGIKQCPGYTDYSQVEKFGERCSFGPRCSFGQWCSFGEGCRFGEECRFGEGCSFGEGCRFGEECVYNNHKLRPGYPLLQMNGAGSANRGTNAWNTEDGIIVRCGCFEGNLAAFRAQVRKTHGDTSKHTRVYLGFANLCALQFDRPEEIES